MSVQCCLCDGEATAHQPFIGMQVCGGCATLLRLKKIRGDLRTILNEIVENTEAMDSIQESIYMIEEAAHILEQSGNVKFPVVAG